MATTLDRAIHGPRHHVRRCLTDFLVAPRASVGLGGRGAGQSTHEPVLTRVGFHGL
jgi:hypothetical protein